MAPAADSRALQACLVARGEALAAARPTMTPVAVLPQGWADDIASLSGRLPVTALRRLAADRAESRRAASRAAGWRAAQLAASRLPASGALLTLSDSGTVRHVFSALAQAGKQPEIIVAESRPGYEGHALARAAVAAGLPARLITEAQLARVAPRCAAGLVGADAVLPDGSCVNKVGSHLLALALAAADKPLYVVAESFKQRPARLGVPEMEAGPASELAPPAGVAGENVYFEIVPAHLVTAVLAENGR